MPADVYQHRSSSHPILDQLISSLSSYRLLQAACTTAALAVPVLWDRPGFAEAEAGRGLRPCSRMLCVTVPLTLSASLPIPSFVGASARSHGTTA